MAKSVSNSALRRQVWAKNLFVDAMATVYFVKNKLMGTDPNNAILIQDDLQKERGDRVHFKLTQKLSGRGVRGDNELEGNEERMIFYSESVLIDQIRNAVRLEGTLDEQKDAYDKRTEAKDLLKTWIAEFIEMQIMLKAGGVTNSTLTNVAGQQVALDYDWSNTPDFIPDADENAGFGARYLCADSAAGTTSLATTDLITPALISRLRVMAQTASPKVLPLNIGGEDKYVLMVHPWQAYDLKRNAEFVQAQREALPRSTDHPLFKSGQLVGEWDGVMIVQHDFVPFLDVSVAGHSFRGAAVGTDCANDAFRAILFGRQAVGYAKAQNRKKEWVEKNFDYDNEYGVATSLLGGIQKLVFNGKEYGCMVLDTYATHLA